MLCSWGCVTRERALLHQQGAAGAPRCLLAPELHSAPAPAVPAAVPAVPLELRMKTRGVCFSEVKNAEEKEVPEYPTDKRLFPSEVQQTLRKKTRTTKHFKVKINL